MLGSAGPIQVFSDFPGARFPGTWYHVALANKLARQDLAPGDPGTDGDDIGAHPVGTGPFTLAEWKRSSKIVLARNPGYRVEYYDAEPPADDPLSQQLGIIPHIRRRRREGFQNGDR